DALDVVADGPAVFDPDDSDFLAALPNPLHIGGCQSELDIFWRDLLGEAMDRVELRDRLTVPVLVAGWRQFPLSDIDDEKRDAQAAFLHLRQIHLRRQ